MKIALIGKARTGKDTVGDYLREKYQFKRFYFAKGIEEIIIKYFPSAFDNGKPRGHYLHIGQSMREIDSHVWINYTHNEIEKYLSDNPSAHIMITDCRQLNEATFLREQGYKLIKIVCDESKRIERILDKGEYFDFSTLYHDTEIQSDLIIPDLYIHNNGTLEQLEDSVERALDYLRMIEGGSYFEN